MVILCYMHIKCFPLYSGASLIAYAIDFCQNSEWDNYEDWKESLDLYLAITNMDLALREAEPPTLTDQSTVADKASREKWDHSNRVCLMVMKYTMEKSIRQSILETDNVVTFLKSVGSLMYAPVCTRPDIAFAVNVLGRYLSNPSLNHWKAVKKVMRYLQGTKDYMLIYKRSDQLEVTGYSNSDFAMSLVMRLLVKPCG